MWLATCRLLYLLFVPGVVPAGLRAQGLQGDADAVAMAHRMMDTMGGHVVWTRAVALEVHEEAYPIAFKAPEKLQLWRMLREPSLWGHGESPERTRTFAFTATQGWARVNGQVTMLSEDEVLTWRRRWPANIYVMYHRLARRDPALLIVKQGDQRFEVHDGATRQRLCSFVVNAAGEIVKWITDSEEWVYGPLTEFGGVKMPAWGARVDGVHRFRYTLVRLSTVLPTISLDPPRSR